MNRGLRVDGIDDSSGRQHQTELIGHHERRFQPNRYQEIVTVGPDREVVGGRTDDHLNGTAIRPRCVQTNRNKPAQKIGNIAAQQLMLDQGLTLRAAHLLDRRSEFFARRRSCQPSRDALRQRIIARHTRSGSRIADTQTEHR